MTVEYEPAAEAAKIAKGVIKDHHRHLTEVRIEYVFRDKHQTSNGREVWAKTRKVAGLHAYLAAESEHVDAEAGEPFFVVELAKDIWQILNKGQREALIDHELCKCSAEFNDDGDVALKVKPHDLEEFRAVVERRGLWRPDVTEFLRAAKAADLFDMLDQAAGPDGDVE